MWTTLCSQLERCEHRSCMPSVGCCSSCREVILAMAELCLQELVCIWHKDVTGQHRCQPFAVLSKSSDTTVICIAEYLGWHTAPDSQRSPGVTLVRSCQEFTQVAMEISAPFSVYSTHFKGFLPRLTTRHPCRHLNADELQFIANGTDIEIGNFLEDGEGTLFCKSPWSCTVSAM